MPKHLSPEQVRAATLLNTPLSVTASAGSGKTSTLVERYLRLLKNGFRPRDILTVTFTKEAAQELKERIVERVVELGLSNETLEELESSNRIGTIHSLCYSILNQYGGEIGLLPIQRIIEDSQFLAVFFKLYRDWLDHLPQDTLNALLDHFTHRELEEMARTIFRQRHLFFDCLSLAQEAKAKDKGAQVIGLLAQALNPLLRQVADTFHQQGAFSFDDLEHFALRILRDCALARTRLRNDLKQILIDEFQDTSAIQWQILSTLVGENFEKLFVVGDPKQSIYGFRYAEPQLFEVVGNLIESHKGERLELLRNFRAEPSLLSQLNQISSQLFEGQPFGWSPMLSGKAAEETSPSRTLGLHWKFFGPHEKSTKKEIQFQELNAVVSEVASLISAGVEPRSIALLFRNSDRITEFSDTLLAAGIPTECKRTLSLSKNLDALDLVSFLQFLSNPLNDSALVRFLRSPYMNWSYDQILGLTSLRQKENEKLEPLLFVLFRNAPKNLEWLVSLLKRGETKISQCLEALFFHTQQFPSCPESLDILLSFMAQESPELSEAQNFLEAFPSSELFFQEETNSATKGAGIKLMTVHASKGLEFEHVFLVDLLRQLPQDLPPVLLKAGIPPGIRFWEGEQRVFSGSYESILEERKTKETEEARRILYVALTRARYSLTVFMPKEDAIKYPTSSWAQLLDASVRTKLESHAQTEATIGVGTTD